MCLEFYLQERWFLITCVCALLVVSQGRVDGNGIFCCVQILRNTSVVYNLSEAPHSDCTTQWSYNSKVIVDANGGTDKDMVLKADNKSVMLRANYPGILYNLECPDTDVSTPVNCTDLCEQTVESQGIPVFVICIIAVGIMLIIAALFICIMRKRQKRLPESHGDHLEVQTSFVC